MAAKPKRNLKKVFVKKLFTLSCYHKEKGAYWEKRRFNFARVFGPTAP